MIDLRTAAQNVVAVWNQYRTAESLRGWMEILEATLEQPEEEPVAHLWQHSETGRTRVVMPDQVVTADATWHVVGPLYTHPPRREWRGLTDWEINEATFHADERMNTHLEFARAIEAALKEKNA